MPSKLSPSGIVDYLRSPKYYYWSRVYNNGEGLEPLEPSVERYDHDKIFGQVWAAFVWRFYLGVFSEDNLLQAREEWYEMTQGWVPEQIRARYSGMLNNLAADYYTQFSQVDGARTQSEVWYENDFLRGRVDGINSANIVHEVKTTRRSLQLAEQLWKVENSIQVKSYAVLAKAEGVQIEFAFKDAPQVSYRAPVRAINRIERFRWESELRLLAADIEARGGAIESYTCNPDGCCFVSKNFVRMCPYKPLCDGNMDALKEFKPRRAKDASRIST